MFSFLSLIKNSLTIGLRFSLMIISSIISSKTINILLFLFGLYSPIFLWISSVSFEYSIKAFESFKYFNPVLSLLLISNWHFALYRSFAYKKILSTSGYLFIKLSNAFVFPDLEPPIINIWYGGSEILGQFQLCYFISSFVT